MKLWSYGMVAWTFAVGAAGALTMAACSDSNLGTGPGSGDGGASGCPANPPTVGTTCLLASSTSCSYPQDTPSCECCGGSPTYECDNGKWTELATANGGAGTGTGAAPACPATLPEAGSYCNTFVGGGCGEPAQQECSYDCAQGGTATALCTGSQWMITTNGECFDDAGDDAGDGGDAADGS